MIDWRLETGDVASAFEAAERSLARTLVDQLTSANIDLLAGLPSQEAERLRQNESEAKERVAQREAELQAFERRSKVSEGGQERDQILAAVEAARSGLVDAYIAIRNASPAYRQAVGKDFKPASIRTIQDQLAKPNG